MVQKVPFVRSAYNYDRDSFSDASGLFCDPETDEGRSRTVQSQAEEADINVIVKRFGLTGQIPSGIRTPTYGDFLNVYDFQSAMNAIRQAQESFDAMPAEVRSRFHNDPNEFVNFCSELDEDGKYKNLEEMEKLGLTKPVPEVKVDPVVEAINGLKESLSESSTDGGPKA